ncbi:MAG TPA: bifunctional homocysteine S-methyltransferase/methylenetetrahydrofolate reductase, partial [Bryobacterales bacterium]|nr:bifunctional homocysteine S-methyltransferase/methylenetetrahydrofolate reductase [Bryobacterales bacterium]
MPAGNPQNRAKEFRERLRERVIVADGAMGTMLYSKGVFINRCYDELNLVQPSLVKGIHEEYVKAGAEILETNTYGANRARLAGYGLADKAVAINQAGVKLAREAAGEKAFVAGSIGPLGSRVEPLGSISVAEAKEIFGEQARALVEAGVDLLILETFGDIVELGAAVEAAREAAGDEMVIVAEVTIDDYGRLPTGMSTEDFTRALNEMPADVIGCNCSVGPKVMLETIEKMVKVAAKPLSAMPNAGLPVRVEGRNMYLCSPEYMSQYARRLLWAGVKIIGGCCGTTPAHIREIVSEVRSLQPAHRPVEVELREEEVKAKALPKVPMERKSQLGAKLAAGKFVS